MNSQSSVNSPKTGLKTAQNSAKHYKRQVMRAVFALLKHSHIAKDPDLRHAASVRRSECEQLRGNRFHSAGRSSVDVFASRFQSSQLDEVHLSSQAMSQNVPINPKPLSKYTRKSQATGWIAGVLTWYCRPIGFGQPLAI